MSVMPWTDRQYIPLPGRRSADPLAGIDSVSSLRIVDLERTEGRTAHRHPHSEEVVVVSAGKGHVWIDGEIHAVVEGDVVHIPAGIAHATIPEEGSRMELVCFFPHSDLSENIEETDIEVS